MLPEETVKAAQDLKADALLPVHWAKFSLALHPWNESIERVINASKENNLKITTPKIGQPVIFGADFPKETWWNFK